MGSGTGLVGRAGGGGGIGRPRVALAALFVCTQLAGGGCHLVAPYEPTVNSADAGPDGAPLPRSDATAHGDNGADAATDAVRDAAAVDAGSGIFDAASRLDVLSDAPAGDGATTSPDAVAADADNRPPGSIIFTTSTRFAGDFLGIQPPVSPDRECSRRARINSVPGDFQALLSTPTMEALELASAIRYPVVNVDGDHVEAHDLFDGTGIDATILDDEGSTRQATWTGSFADGHRSGINCTGWTSRLTTFPGRGTHGIIGTGEDWFGHSGNGSGCNLELSFYCIQTGSFAPLQ